MEPRACLSLWPTEECEWSTWNLWRSSDMVQRTIYLSLALMLGYTFFVLLRFLVRYYSRHRDLPAFGSRSGIDSFLDRRKLICGLSQGLLTLKGISAAAPFLGLAGTSYGILAGLFVGYSGSPRGYFALVFTRIAFGSAPTLAGILVAVPAVVFHNLVRTCIENFSVPGFSTHNCTTSGLVHFRLAQTLPLKRRFSSLPPFATLAAPALACVVVLFTPFHPYRAPTGLTVLLPSFRCRPEVSDRIIVLRVMANRELFINQEPIAWTDLPRRLSAVYSTRALRELYLLAEDGASLQTVADAIDAVRSIQDAEFNSLHIKVLLITPQAWTEREKCFAPIQRHFRQRPGDRRK